MLPLALLCDGQIGEIVGVAGKRERRVARGGHGRGFAAT